MSDVVSLSDRSAAGRSRRTVIVHYHLFKNGGSSIERMLRDGLGDAWASFDRDAPGARISADDLARFIAERPSLRAVSSHQLVPPLPTGDVDIVPIVFLRDPLARVRSAWLFEWQKQSGSSQPRGSLADYVESKLERSGVNVIANFQVSRLSNADPTDPRQSFDRHDRTALRRACDWLDSLPFFGLVERFADSLELMAPELSRRFPDLPLVEHRENVLQPVGDKPVDPGERLRAEIGDALYDRLLLHNLLDLQFHAHAQARFAARLDALRAADASTASDPSRPAARFVRAAWSRLPGARRG